jgi:hypothetical protein
MADINWTTALPQPNSFRFELHSPTLAWTSPLSRSVQTVGMPGARWACSVAWPGMLRAHSAAMEALLVQLRGRANRLVLWNIARPTLRGVGGGSPVVNGGSQTGNAISITGLPINTTGWAVAGDMLGIGGELKMVTASVNSNGSGVATVTFEPPLRASPANSSAITVSMPTAKFITTTDVVGWTTKPARIVDEHKLELIEAF